jgi:hypothetical protein
MKNKFTKYTFTLRYGMEGFGDMELEGLTDDEREEKFRQNNLYIEECKAKGIYGKEYTQTVEVENDPLLDKRYVIGVDPYKEASESYSFIITNFESK